MGWVLVRAQLEAPRQGLVVGQYIKSPLQEMSKVTNGQIRNEQLSSNVLYLVSVGVSF